MIWLHYYLLTIIKNWFINLLFSGFFWITWAAFIAVLSFIPGDQLPVFEWNFLSIDTLVHFIMYSVLAFSMLGAGMKKKLNLSLLSLYLLVVSAGIAYGTAIELIQGFYIYQRYFDPADILANTIGTIFGVVAVKLTGIKLV